MDQVKKTANTQKRRGEDIPLRVGEVPFSSSLSVLRLRFAGKWTIEQNKKKALVLSATAFRDERRIRKGKWCHPRRSNTENFRVGREFMSSRKPSGRATFARRRGEDDGASTELFSYFPRFITWHSGEVALLLGRQL